MKSCRPPQGLEVLTERTNGDRFPICREIGRYRSRSACMPGHTGGQQISPMLRSAVISNWPHRVNGYQALNPINGYTWPTSYDKGDQLWLSIHSYAHQECDILKILRCPRQQVGGMRKSPGAIAPLGQS